MGIAYLLVIPIGWDRERSERSAGLRTFPLVAIAAYGFFGAAQMVARDNAEATARMVEGVITGIEFIGGSAIIKSGTSVSGGATAASYWWTGAIGVAAGLGIFAEVISSLAFVILRFLAPLKQGGN